MIRKNRPEKNFTPENTDEKSIASCLNRIYKRVDIEGLSTDAINELDEDISVITDAFGISPKAAVLLAAILEKNNNCDESDLADYLGCTNIEFIDFHEAIRQMEDKGILDVCRGRRTSFVVTSEFLKAVENKTEFVPLPIAGISAEELFSRMRIHFGNFRHDRIDADRLIYELDRLVEKNDQLLFCRKVLESALNDKCYDSERRIFYYLCHRYVSFGNKSVPIDTLMNLLHIMEDEQRIRRTISNEKSSLQTEGLVTFGFDEGMHDEKSLSLSDDVKKTFFDEIELAKEAEINHKDIIRCATLKEQELFYNPCEGEQVARLMDLLDDTNFRTVQQRLEAEGLPKGFCAILHGGPGSGKTATLKALAKKTGRDIFWVDLAGIKSKWVGESEQNVKQLFDTYRKLVKTSEKAPILAVNEADAIFTKRITNVEQSVDAMLNAMTDIVLNEMETLDGIMIATTNLAGNMMDSTDNAMERRFLYKIEFKQPEEGVRAKIWKSKIKGLSDEDAAVLASKYEFSGGNIENVARKSTVEYVLSGKRPDLDALMKYCDEETISKKQADSKKIGFAG